MRNFKQNPLAAQDGEVVASGPGYGPGYQMTLHGNGATLEPLFPAYPVDEYGDIADGHQVYRTPGSTGKLAAAGQA